MAKMKEKKSGKAISRKVAAPAFFGGARATFLLQFGKKSLLKKCIIIPLLFHIFHIMAVGCIVRCILHCLANSRYIPQVVADRWCTVNSSFWCYFQGLGLFAAIGNSRLWTPIAIEEAKRQIIPG